MIVIIAVYFWLVVIFLFNAIIGFFRKPVDFSQIKISYNEWLIDMRQQVSVAIKLNLAQMQQEVKDYTVSVNELNAVDSALTGAKDAQIVRLKELSRSFERAQGSVSITI